MKIVVGTRGSQLATTQTAWVIDKLKQKYPFVQFEMCIVQTKGDRDQETSLEQVSDKGFFTSDIEEKLLNDEIDLAVHSMKDMPSKLPEGLCFAAVPRREDARDALILKKGYSCLEDLPIGAKIGTDSKRRAYQLQTYREDLNVVSIRGNIDTRIKKLQAGEYDGIVLAVAGLKRLGLEEYITYCFEIDELIPAPCQGILAIEVKSDNQLVIDIVKSIEDPISAIQCQGERAFMKAVDGGCKKPMGAYCNIEGNHIRIKGLLGDENGEKLIIREMCGPIGVQEMVGSELARLLKSQLNSLN